MLARWIMIGEAAWNCLAWNFLDGHGKETKVLESFGFNLHLSADAKHELSLAHKITSTKAQGASRSMAQVPSPCR
jgi:hypothetical protein